MKLTNLTAQRLLIGLRSVDADESTKLDGEARMKIAININRLTPSMQAFERVAQRLQADAGLNRVNGEAVTKVNDSVLDELRRLSDATDDYMLKKLSKDELRLKENPKIKADTIAMLAPVIKDFDDGASDDG